MFNKLLNKAAAGGDLDEFKQNRDLETFKHFRIIRRLGKGSYSTVYEVERVDDHLRYALKATDVSRLSHEENLGMVEEIRLLASLRHPNVLKYYEAFVDANYLCIVTELVNDGDVHSLLSRCRDERRTLPESSVWSIVIQTLSALGHLHQSRLLHRDIKPGNLLLSGRRVLLADFGISRLLDHIFTRTQLGTPGYMSPEMWRNEPYSLSSDIWALGCVAYELCALQPLFTGDSEAEIKRKVLHSYGINLPSAYSSELYILISRMLDPDPVMRPTARELLDSPVVQKRLGYLPTDARAALLPGTPALAPNIIKPITVPRDLRELNSLLPPAQYEKGAALAQLLCSRCASEGNLAALAEVPSKALRKSNSHNDLVGEGKASAPGLGPGPDGRVPMSDPRRTSVNVGEVRFFNDLVGGTGDLRLTGASFAVGYRGPRSDSVARSSISVATISEMRQQRLAERGMPHPRDMNAQMRRRFSQQTGEKESENQFDDPRPFELCPINRSSFVAPMHNPFALRVVPDLHQEAAARTAASRLGVGASGAAGAARAGDAAIKHAPQAHPVLESSRSQPFDGQRNHSSTLSPTYSAPITGKGGKMVDPKAAKKRNKFWKLLPSL